MKYLYPLLLFFVFNKFSYSQGGVGINTPSPDTSAILDIVSNGKGLLPPRMTSVQRSTIPSPATGLLVFQTDGESGYYYFNGSIWTRLQSGSVHYTGELFGGGIVAWVDQKGEHGLIISLIDLSTAAAWSNITNVEIGPTAQSTWNGQGNTNAIIGQAGHTASAAKLCDDYTNADYGTGILSDWYLPSMDQMNKIFVNRFEINKAIETAGMGQIFSDLEYWTSRENGSNDAFILGIYSASGFSVDSKNQLKSVRAMREF